LLIGEAAPRERERNVGTVNGNVEAAQQMRQRADVILVRVRATILTGAVVEVLAAIAYPASAPMRIISVTDRLRKPTAAEQQLSTGTRDAALP
jgi:hypothetical protein